MKKNENGFTLLQCMLALTVILILGRASFMALQSNRSLALQSYWGRTAEALADGALEMALAYLAEEEEDRVLERNLSTGKASAEVVLTNDPGVYRIAYSGVVSTERKVRSVRRYEALVSKSEGESPKVLSVSRAVESAGP